MKFMWGNLAVGSGDRWREVSVPFLQPGQVRRVKLLIFNPKFVVCSVKAMVTVIVLLSSKYFLKTLKADWLVVCVSRWGL